MLTIDTHRHFAKAAEKCFVMQPALNMMLQKLDEGLDAKIFDRSKQPVAPTEAGVLVIKQAKIILQEANRLKLMVDEL